MVAKLHRLLIGASTVLLLLFVNQPQSQCPDLDYFLLSSSDSKIESKCFLRFLSSLPVEGKKEHQDSLTLIVKKWVAQHKIETSFLFSCYHIKSIYKKYPVWQTIVSAWERDNGAVYEKFVNMVNSGMHFQADTLFTIFDAEGKLDTQDLLRWARVKSIINDYNKIAGLYCRVIQKDMVVREIAFHQFGRILEDLEIETAKIVLEQFHKCSIVSPEADTFSVYFWLADTYSKLGLYKEELQILTHMSALKYSVSQRALEAARVRISLHRYRDAIDAALLSYKSTDRFAFKSVAAIILYNAYIGLNKADSAAIWIKQADLSSDRNRIEAATVYQSLGDTEAAGLLIDSLPKSLGRDTLTIRQFLFKGEPERALSYFKTRQAHINRDLKNGLLWKSRVLLYSNQIEDLRVLLDTVEIEPYWECASELIMYQYWMELLEHSKVALAAFANIEYNLYVDSLQRVSHVFTNYQIPDEYMWKLVLHAAKGCLNREQHAVVLQLLSLSAGPMVSPEFLYLKAEALYRNGENQSAQKILNSIILEHSQDLYAQKARIFLSQHGLIK